MLDSYMKDIQNFLSKDTNYNPAKIYDGLHILMDYNNYGPKIPEDSRTKVLTPITTKLQSLIALYNPKENITPDVKYFFNTLKTPQTLFDTNQIEKTINDLYGIKPIYGQKHANASIEVSIKKTSENNQPPTTDKQILTFDAALLKDKKISLPNLLAANGASFAENHSKASYFTMNQETYQNVKDFLQNLSNTGNLEKAFSASDIISVGKMTDDTPTLNELWKVFRADDKNNNKHTFYFDNKFDALKFWKQNDGHYQIAQIPTTITERDWDLLKSKERHHTEQTKKAMETKHETEKTYFIQIANTASPKKFTREEILHSLSDKEKNALLKEIKVNYPEKEYIQFENYTRKQLSDTIIEGRLERPDWIDPNDEVVSSTKTRNFPDIFTAVKANNELRKLFDQTKIFESPETPIDSNVIIKINNYNQLITDIKTTICNSLLTGDSVLLHNRGGIKYTLNTSTKKPFENVQQLYLQQIRDDNHFKSTFFMPSLDVRNNGFDVVPKSLATALSHINKDHNKIEFTYFFNGDQLKPNAKTLDISKTMLESTLETPFLKGTEVPPVKIYEPKNYSLSENFARQISLYFESIYTGKPYEAPKYSKEELKTLINYIAKDNSNFFQDVQNAHRAVKNSLIVDMPKRRRDHARKL